MKPGCPAMTKKADGTIFIDDTMCTGCGLCESLCKFDAIELVKEGGSDEKRRICKERGIEELKSSRAERFTIKSMERTKKGLETKLKKLLESGRKDDVVTFEELGVDRLLKDTL